MLRKETVEMEHVSRVGRLKKTECYSPKAAKRDLNENFRIGFNYLHF